MRPAGTCAAKGLMRTNQDWFLGEHRSSRSRSEEEAVAKSHCDDE